MWQENLYTQKPSNESNESWNLSYHIRFPLEFWQYFVKAIWTQIACYVLVTENKIPGKQQEFQKVIHLHLYKFTIFPLHIFTELFHKDCSSVVRIYANPAMYIHVYTYITQIYSGITSGRVLDGELLYTKILEVNLFAFAYRLFHEDFSSIDGTYVSSLSMLPFCVNPKTHLYLSISTCI